MRWEDLLFMHWPVPADTLRPLIPAGLELDLYDGTAWLGVVPFRMRNTRLRFLPPLPSASSFPELNVRTYVTDGNKPLAAAVYIFFLARNGILYREDGSKRLADNALVALTLLIAESKPQEKETIVKVIVKED